jgi:phosphoribosylamine--glycine ligase
LGKKIKILLIGQGAREHAIAKALKKSDNVRLFAFMKAKNPGIASLAEEITIAQLNDFKTLKTFARKVKPTFAVIGPEYPLAEGIVDFLNDRGIKCIGPTQAAAKIESSKSFTRELMTKYRIPGLPEYRTFSKEQKEEELREYIQRLGKVAVKRDGLAGGKGVKLMGEHLQDVEEAMAYCREVFEKDEKVVIEELLEGEEFSLQCFVSGTHVIASPIAQDHKRAYEGDTGPNTGGMGSYSGEDHLLPFISREVVQEARYIVMLTARALRQETGTDYCGILYGGFMLTDKGLRLLEYNARFGDPEAMNILPILETPLVEIFEAMINGTLFNKEITFSKKATVCKYLVPKGYPVDPASGQPIRVQEKEIKDIGAELYYSSVNEVKPGEIITTTSRSIAVVGIAKNPDEAETIAEKATSHIEGPLFHRTDVGTKELIQKRIDHLKELDVL